ncbi:VWA containing CoxE family protein [Pseudoalteromonas luteoviolacea CPMOR-1]|uniref:VWA containing CoxE family protein n=1 Tax=Pseudoalteromonas luteoviolacea CPMOR-1 TaxID=1365248 RepID=A0A167JC64_9GAMM|nr:VWA domain-containing protein [Pseudoalteromonas luteoviolacea]KZN60891.1 VWA containing CoxE family protein [Pseudoalteromonas luteoviolacea CPMOR-1]
MLIAFLFTLRKHGINASLRELMDCIGALEKGLCFGSIEDFYALARVIFVKDETLFDKFDRAFAEYFEGVEQVDVASAITKQTLPHDWLRKEFEKQLSDAEKAKLKSLGGLDNLMDTLKKRLAEQQKRHAGGNKWIGTGGTSPFGAYGYNPEGVRTGQHTSQHRQAVKVWDKRQYKNLDKDADLSSRNMKLVLKQLRQFAQSGHSDKIDLNQTIDATAKQGGMLNVKMAPQRENTISVLMLFDIGGSMDDHIQICEQLFSAAHSQFKHLEFYYFHNCVYEHVWKNNDRLNDSLIDTYQLINKFGKNYRLIFVGDATMGPYEISYPGGSVEHWNQEPGAVWLNRLTSHFDRVAWLNPQPRAHWPYYQSIQQIDTLMDSRMFPLSIDGITQAVKSLT